MIIEKFEASAKEVGFAVVLLTPDDLGSAVTAAGQTHRGRQNVIFELGYFAGTLGRGRVCLLRRGEVEMPSDLFWVVYTDMDPAEGWKGGWSRNSRRPGSTSTPTDCGRDRSRRNRVRPRQALIAAAFSEPRLAW